MSIFSDRLKWIREKENVSQKSVADAVGMSQQGYSKVELGQREPNLETLFKIRHVFEESLDFLIGYTLQDVKAEQLYELYAEARKSREEAEEDESYFNETLKESPEEADKLIKLARNARDNIKKFQTKEDKAFNMFFEHLISIPGAQGEFITKEFWINWYHSYQEGDKKTYNDFVKEFHDL